MDRVRCLLTAIILISCTPLSILYLLAVLMCTRSSNIPNKKRIPISSTSMTVMLTGGKFSKSLHFARWFWKWGYRVVMVESKKYRWCGARWSRAVAHFEIITSPRIDPDKYVEDLVRIAEKHKVDYFVPVSSPASAVHASRAKPLLENLGCRVLHFDLNVTKTLDNKHEFGNYARSLGLDVPLTFCVTSDECCRSINKRLLDSIENEKAPKAYILKNIEYDPIHRLDMFKLPCNVEELNVYLQKISDDGNPITAKVPWQVQQYIEGTEYTCMAVLREGHIRALTVSESSPSQLNYEHKDVPAITKWVQQFAAQTQLTGQLCWDFMMDCHTQKIYPLECNPRIHSQCAVFIGKPEFGLAVLSEDWEEGFTLVPDSSAPHVFWLYNELFKILPQCLFPGYRKFTDNCCIGNLMHLIKTGRDSDLDLADPAPFLLRNHLQLPMLLFDTFWNNIPWVKLDFCIGKVVELGGD